MNSPKRFSILLIALVLVQVLFLAPVLQAETYYVADNGDDAASGTTPNTPFRTLQRAIDVSLPGDIVKIKTGGALEYTPVPTPSKPAKPLKIN